MAVVLKCQFISQYSTAHLADICLAKRFGSAKIAGTNVMIDIGMQTTERMRHDDD